MVDRRSHMTPYAVLMMKPNATDVAIRSAFHAIARQTHPDSPVVAAMDARGKDAARKAYAEATEAYAAIKTAVARAEWARSQAFRSGVCRDCRGAGVVGYEVRLCAACGGEGRVGACRK